MGRRPAYKTEPIEPFESVAERCKSSRRQAKTPQRFQSESFYYSKQRSIKREIMDIQRYYEFYVNSGNGFRNKPIKRKSRNTGDLIIANVKSEAYLSDQTNDQTNDETIIGDVEDHSNNYSGLVECIESKPQIDYSFSQFIGNDEHTITDNNQTFNELNDNSAQQSIVYASTSSSQKYYRKKRLQLIALNNYENLTIEDLDNDSDETRTASPPSLLSLSCSPPILIPEQCDYGSDESNSYANNQTVIANIKYELEETYSKKLQNELKAIINKYTVDIEIMKSQSEKKLAFANKEIVALKNELSKAQIQLSSLKKEIPKIKKFHWCCVCENEAHYYCCWRSSYCSSQCQTHHWINGHKNSCRRNRTENAA